MCLLIFFHIKINLSIQRTNIKNYDEKKQQQQLNVQNKTIIEVKSFIPLMKEWTKTFNI